MVEAQGDVQALDAGAAFHSRDSGGNSGDAERVFCIGGLHEDRMGGCSGWARGGNARVSRWRRTRDRDAREAGGKGGRGQPLVTLFAEDEARFAEPEQLLTEALVVGDAPVAAPPLVREIIRRTTK